MIQQSFVSAARLLFNWQSVVPTGRVFLVKWLLNHGCRPSAQTKQSKETALHRAIQMLAERVSSTKTKSHKESIIQLIGNALYENLNLNLVKFTSEGHKSMF